MRSEIGYAVAQLLEVCADLFLVLEAGVVRTDGNFHNELPGANNKGGNLSMPFGPSESGVALRLPPQSKMTRGECSSRERSETANERQSKSGGMRRTPSAGASTRAPE